MEKEDKNCYTLPDGSCIGQNCMHTRPAPSKAKYYLRIATDKLESVFDALFITSLLALCAGSVIVLITQIVGG